MSAKYNESPMEQKAEAGIAANRHERDKRAEAYKRWHAWYYQSSEHPPTSEESFNAGWVERNSELNGEQPK